jgi:multimeric flavodoxin WrbA
MDNRVLILNGSPRKGKSTTGVFAEAFADHYKKLGGEVNVLSVRISPESAGEILALEAAVSSADIIGLFFPLYVDSLPSNLLVALYHIEPLLKKRTSSGTPIKIFATTQCGYPITANMQHAINNCRLFTSTIEGKWLGSLSYGGGVLINGTPLGQLKRKGVKLNKVFSGMAEAVFHGEVIPESVFKPVYQELKPLTIHIMVPLLNFLFKLQWKKAGKDIEARPYEGETFTWE